MASTLPFLPSPVGRLITFEGIDGSGKSTALAAVAAALQEGVPTWSTREETDRFGPAIRRSIQAASDPWVTTQLFLADRFAHAPQIRRHMTKGEMVLCDRFLHSTLAYQGAALASRLDDPMARLREMHAPLALEPDMVLWFDVPVDVALERIGARGDAAPYERRAFLEQVAANYRRLAQEETRFVRIDAARGREEVSQAALDLVRPLAGTPGAVSD